MIGRSPRPTTPRSTSTGTRCSRSSVTMSTSGAGRRSRVRAAGGLGARVCGGRAGADRGRRWSVGGGRPGGDGDRGGGGRGGSRLGHRHVDVARGRDRIGGAWRGRRGAAATGSSGAGRGRAGSGGGGAASRRTGRATCEGGDSALASRAGGAAAGGGGGGGAAGGGALPRSAGGAASTTDSTSPQSPSNGCAGRSHSAASVPAPRSAIRAKNPLIARRAPARGTPCAAAR